MNRDTAVGFDGLTAFRTEADAAIGQADGIVAAAPAAPATERPRPTSNRDAPVHRDGGAVAGGLKKVVGWVVGIGLILVVKACIFGGIHALSSSGSSSSYSAGSSADAPYVASAGTTAPDDVAPSPTTWMRIRIPSRSGIRDCDDGHSGRHQRRRWNHAVEAGDRLRSARHRRAALLPWRGHTHRGGKSGNGHPAVRRYGTVQSPRRCLQRDGERLQHPLLAPHICVERQAACREPDRHAAFGARDRRTKPCRMTS